jgi:acetyl-CoA decarbonylase/synthase complex subunit gamma
MPAGSPGRGLDKKEKKMALTGVQIFKLLPKTNCGECGVPTCLAFAMNLGAGKAELTQCPYVSDEAKAQLSQASAPPIRTVEIGTGAAAVKVGGETVLFRHEKTFYNKTALALRISDDEPDKDVDAKIARFKELRYIRVGLELKADLVALKCKSGDAGKFEALVKKAAGAVEAPFILMSDKPDVIKAALAHVKDRRPLIYGADDKNADAMADLAREFKCPLAVRGEGLDAVAAITEKLAGKGLSDLVIDPGSGSVRKVLEDQVAIRRLSIQKQFRPLGYPTICLPCDMTDDPMKEAMLASLLIPKYAGIVVLGDVQGHTLFPLLLERLNIYTDPQRPMKTDEGLYEFNNPGAGSPVLVTSNFSLTYFIVSGEIDNSRQPAYLLVMDTDGLSVLTAWAAGKFGGDQVAALVKKVKLDEKIQKKNIVLPGLVASILGDVEEEIGEGWTVHVGPREASTIPAYLKQNYA